MVPLTESYYVDPKGTTPKGFLTFVLTLHKQTKGERHKALAEQLAKVLELPIEMRLKEVAPKKEGEGSKEGDQGTIQNEKDNSKNGKRKNVAPTKNK